MTTDVSTNTKKGTNGPLWVGVLLIGLGIAGLALPVFSTVFAEVWFALIMISAGSAKLTYAFQTRNEGGFISKLLLGILYIGTGLMLFVYPRIGILTLTLLLGTYLLTEGVFELILAFQLRPRQNWTSVLTNGIVTLLLGGFVWFQWPSDAPWVLGTVVGASVLFTGISRVLLSLNPPSDLNQSNQPTSA